MPGPDRLLTRRHGMRRSRFWLVLGLHLIAALLSAGFLLLMLTEPLGAPRPPSVLMLGEDELRKEAARLGLPAGRMAPGFGADDGLSLSVTDLDGRPTDLGTLSGRPVWIVFWATYCHACQEEEADLRRAYNAHRDDGLEVLAVAAGEPAEDVRPYVVERGLPWRIALDPELRAYDAYGAIGTPTHYFIGRDGRIASRAFGRLDPSEMEGHLARILKGQ